MCKCCTKDTKFEIDHITALAKGGTNEKSNVIKIQTAQDKGAAGGWYAEFWARLRRPGQSISTGGKVTGDLEA